MKHANKLVLAIAILAIFSAGVQAERRERPARVPSTGVLPVVEGTASLTVSSGKYRQQYRYEDGQRPSLSAYDQSGQPLPDGSYRYEYVSILDELDFSESGSPSGIAKDSKRKTRVEKGSFTIRSGVMSFQ